MYLIVMYQNCEYVYIHTYQYSFCLITVYVFIHFFTSISYFNWQNYGKLEFLTVRPAPTHKHTGIIAQNIFSSQYHWLSTKCEEYLILFLLPLPALGFYWDAFNLHICVFIHYVQIQDNGLALIYPGFLSYVTQINSKSFLLNLCLWTSHFQHH